MRDGDDKNLRFVTVMARCQHDGARPVFGAFFAALSMLPQPKI
jgi:hypothetical protein